MRAGKNTRETCPRPLERESRTEQRWGEYGFLGLHLREREKDEEIWGGGVRERGSSAKCIRV